MAAGAQFIVPAIFQGLSFLQSRKAQKSQEQAQERALAQQNAVAQQNATVEAANAQRAAQDLALREKAFNEQNQRIVEQEATVAARETALQTRENARRRARSGRGSGRRSLAAARPGSSELGLLSEDLLGGAGGALN